MLALTSPEKIRTGALEVEKIIGHHRTACVGTILPEHELSNHIANIHRGLKSNKEIPKAYAEHGYSMDKEDELERVTADFQCFVCGAVFTTDQDRRQHLEKELAGKAHEGANTEDTERAKEQTELSESYRQGYESTAV